MEWIAPWIRHYGYFGIFSLLALGIVGVPVPDEWLLTFAGFQVHKGRLDLAPTLLATALGSISGISLSYVLGRTLGAFLAKRFGAAVRLPEERIAVLRGWFERRGRWGLLCGYFVPGLRHLAGYLAGASRLRFPVFAAFAYAGALLWSTSFVFIGYAFGKEWARVPAAVHRAAVIGASVAAVILAVYAIVRRLRAGGVTHV